MNYFFDSYAIIELLKRNPSFVKYEQYPLITGFMNKTEVGWWAILKHGDRLAEALTKSIANVVYVSDDIIIDALRLRLAEKKRDLSYADCIGYCFARKSGFLFLTGDKQFEDMPGVEFVK